MSNLGNNFLRLAVIYGLVGMTLGVFMGLSNDHSQAPTHAHINLLGWVSMALFGLYYRSNERAAGMTMAKWQFWVMNLGVIVMLAALAMFMAGTKGAAPVLGVASLVVLLGMLMFAFVVWRTTASET